MGVSNKRAPLALKKRWQVLERDGFQCRYCGGGAESSPLQVDHMTPVSVGGTNDIENLITSCRDCNLGKRAVETELCLALPVRQSSIDAFLTTLICCTEEGIKTGFPTSEMCAEYSCEAANFLRFLTCDLAEADMSEALVADADEVIDLRQRAGRIMSESQIRNVRDEALDILESLYSIGMRLPWRPGRSLY